MDTGTLLVVIFGTLMFFGFAVWMAFYSRRSAAAGERSETDNSANAEKLNYENERR